MRPSDSPREKAWLNNFEPSEKLAARILLDSVDLVSHDRLRNGLIDLVHQLARTLTGPIALVPVREMTSTQAYYKGDRNSKPQLLASNSFPGSEAILANFATTLRRTNESRGPFVASPSLRNMRAAKCRTILFIEDFSGSGDRILKFDNAFRRHKTILSWLSYHLIEIHVAAFAVTLEAERRLKSHFGDDRVHVHQICPTFSSKPWSRFERAAIDAICGKYHFWPHRSGPFGYLSGRVLMAFSHSVPNNMPPILWQQASNWSSFFTDKSVPSELFPLFGDSTPEDRAEEALRRVGQTRLSTGGWRDAAPEDVIHIMLLLAALSRRPSSTSRISELTSLSSAEISRILAATQRWGLVGPGLRLTDAGLAELSHAKNITLEKGVADLKGSTEPYYPRSLRVGR